MKSNVLLLQFESLLQKKMRIHPAVLCGTRMRIMYYSVSDTGELGKKGNPSAPIRSRT